MSPSQNVFRLAALGYLLAAAPRLLAAPVVAGPQTGQLIPLDMPSYEGVPEIEQAFSAFRQRDYEKTLNLLKEANAKHPETPPARLLLAKLLLGENVVPQARLALEGACIDAPDYPEIYTLFGRLALMDNRISDARLNFEHANQLIEKGTFKEEEKKNFQRDCLNGLATVAEARGDWKGAQTLLERLVTILPEASAPRQRLATALFFLERPDESFGQLEAASKIDPQMAPPSINMGWLFTRKGDLQQAEQWMRKGVEQNPDDPRAHANMAQWLLQQNRAKDANEYILQALAKDNQSTGFLSLRGQIARHLKDYAEAERVFADLSNKFPAEAVYSNLLALALIEQTDRAKHQRAKQLAEVNFRQYPKQADVLTTLGRVYYRLGEVDQAEAALKQAIASGRANSETAYYLAQIAADRGRVDEARELLKKAVDAGGPFAYRDEAMEWLGRLGPAPSAPGSASAPVAPAVPAVPVAPGTNK